MTTARMLRQRVTPLIALAVCSTFVGCSDSSRIDGGGSSHLDARLRGILVSGPISSKFHTLAAGALAADSMPVYVSLPSGSVADGDSALIHATSRAGQTVSAKMIDGGFDPVVIYAITDDSMDVVMFTNHGSVSGLMRIPAQRQPSVIRTTPARGRTDVPLSQVITIVFSQPVAELSVDSTSVTLVTSGDQVVPATLDFDADRPWQVVLTPRSPLAPSSTYRIVVSAKVTDVSGAPLVAPVTSVFTTGQSSPSEVLVLARDGLLSALVPEGVVNVGAQIAFHAYHVTAGDTAGVFAPGTVTWTTQDPSIATVGATGIVKPVAAGATQIKACVSAHCGLAFLLVRAPSTTGVLPTDIGSLGCCISEILSMAGDYAAGISPDSVSGSFHAFLWSANRGIEDLGVPSGSSASYPIMVGSNGDVFGDDGAGHWWRWTRAGGMQPLPLPDNRSDWFPSAINGRGEIAYSNQDGSLIGFWSPLTGPRYSVAPGGSVFVQGMNDAGQVVVFASPDKYYWFNDTTAYVWDTQTNQYTDTLTTSGILPGFAWLIWPSAINNHGMVAGYVFSQTDSEIKMFRWTRASGFTFLDVPYVSITLHGPALDDAGDLVFRRTIPHAGQRGLGDIPWAGVWMANGDVRDLQSLGGYDEQALGINEHNQAGGYSLAGSSAGSPHAVVWNLTPVGSAHASASRRSSARPP